MGLPIHIFDRDIRPTEKGIEKLKLSDAALRTDGQRCMQQQKKK